MNIRNLEDVAIAAELAYDRAFDRYQQERTADTKAEMIRLGDLRITALTKLSIAMDA